MPREAIRRLSSHVSKTVTGIQSRPGNFIGVSSYRNFIFRLELRACDRGHRKGYLVRISQVNGVTDLEFA
jgi:hypothetical protein